MVQKQLGKQEFPNSLLKVETLLLQATWNAIVTHTNVKMVIINVPGIIVSHGMLHAMRSGIVHGEGMRCNALERLALENSNVIIQVAVYLHPHFVMT